PDGSAANAGTTRRAATSTNVVRRFMMFLPVRKSAQARSHRYVRLTFGLLGLAGRACATPPPAQKKPRLSGAKVSSSWRFCEVQATRQAPQTGEKRGTAGGGHGVAHDVATDGVVHVAAVH